MIEVERVSKIFKIPHERTKTLFHKLSGVFRATYNYEEFYAVRDVSLKVNQGEFIGIIGKNGSGKTTLLRLISRILEPTGGRISVAQDIAPFLEIGLGFQIDFTTRENIFINGALLGFSRSELKKRFDDIVEFAGLEKFVDTKLNKLSAGMQVRLAFSIAIQSEAPILIVDEVLAVGDMIFQQKCKDVFWKYKKQGRTVLFVSHDMNLIKEYCDRVFIMHEGSIVKEGNPIEMVSFYQDKFLK
ncbi:MAG: Polysaccharide ABC transporter, ATP-binding protein [Ignavibacteriae bacterium]|nr:MAG: Polysaccharide ABC transporter, ATP-binding protein [Ignavibacteriota bacterium]